MNHLTEEDLVLLYYSEPSPGREHLAECVTCRDAYLALTRTLDACNNWDPPEPDPAFLGRLRTQAAARHRPRPRFVWLAAAAVALLSVAFFAGRASRLTEPAVLAGLSQQARDRILAISLADHLDRAELLLTEIANSSETVNESDRARDLVIEGRLLRQSVTGATAELLDEVERFMLDVANSPGSVSPAQLTHWRDRLNSASLLFKVRILQSNIRPKEEKL